MADTLPPEDIRSEGAPQAPIPPLTGKGLGQIALHDLMISAGHFYGVDDVYFFAGPRGITVTTRKMSDGTHERSKIGEGYDKDGAVGVCLENMRSLEKINSRTRVFVEMTPKAKIGFTTLEHYAPKVAPGSEAHPVPAYLDVLFEDPFNGGHTYQNTIRRDGWQRELRSVVNEFTEYNPDGQRLLETLKIRSLSHLTPEQAVKLSAAFVQSVSKYSSEDVGVKELTTADRSTAIELLREGMANRGNKTWKGNGICRNVAANVKAVFEALKATQTDLSMLANTYAVFDAGLGGQGYLDARPNPSSIQRGPSRDGHAWNTFITIGSEGAAEVTIIDATWALEGDALSAMRHLDRTEVRSAGLMLDLFAKSEVKSKAFVSLTQYVAEVIDFRKADSQPSKSSRENFIEYVTTEYLKIAAGLSDLPDDFELPRAIMAAAFRMRGKLGHEEIETLYVLDAISGGFNNAILKDTIVGYDKNQQRPTPAWKLAENMIFRDDRLQALALDAVGNDRIKVHANESGRFRARVREVRADILPEFNPYDNPADARELSYLVSRHGIHAEDPSEIVKSLHAMIRECSTDDADYQQKIKGRTDYYLAKNLRSILVLSVVPN